MNEPAKHIVAESGVILGIENELVPGRINCISRTADTRTSSAEEQELFHVDEQLFRLLVTQAKFDLETFDEFGVLVTENFTGKVGVAVLNFQV